MTAQAPVQAAGGGVALQASPVLDAPAPAAQVLTPSRTLSFEAGKLSQSLEVSVPHLPGMSELAVTHASLQLHATPVDLPPVSSSAGSMSSEHTLSFGAAQGEPFTGALRQLTVRGFEPSVSKDQKLGLRSSHGAQGLSWAWDEEKKKIVATWGAGPSGETLHLMLLPSGGASSAPMAAAPSFAMPSNKASLYGPVLGGATLELRQGQGGGYDVVLQLNPPLPVAAVRLFLGSEGPNKSGALPQEVGPISWKAQKLEGLWQGIPSDVSLQAQAGGDTAPVADFPGAFPGGTQQVDFSPAARSLFKKLYSPQGATPPRLALQLSAKAAGKLEAHNVSVAARYRFFPLPGQGLAVSLRGAPVSVQVPLRQGLRPEAFSVTLDGMFGAGLRTKAADESLSELSRGLRMDSHVLVARWMPLTAEERKLPLLRLSLLGRASVPTEARVSLHTGDAHRVGPPLGKPLTLRLQPSTEPAWHTGEIPTGLPSLLPAGLWAVVQVPRGVLWWYARFDGAAGEGPLGMRSTDGGATWEPSPARPVLQLHVEKLDPATHLPTPLPLRLTGLGQVLSPDVLALAPAQAGTASRSFRLEGVALLGTRLAKQHALDTLGAGAFVTLTFSCERDVDFRLLDATLAYDPWAAKGP